jgi:DNA-binding transcriptional MerR regulator
MKDGLTLGALGRLAGLARSSLLHYEALGLLRPMRRSAAGYRFYGEAEVEQLRAIRRLRDAGLPLAAIVQMLGAQASRGAKAPKDPSEPATLIEARLLGICAEVEDLRRQQKLLARLLAMPEFRAGDPCSDKASWVALLRRAGFTEEDMWQWHADFEAESPAAHAAFLRSLRLSATDVAAIRRAAKAAAQPSLKQPGARRG